MQKPVVMSIYCPKGIEGAYLGEFSSWKDEKEYLLQRGTKLMLKEVKEKDGKIHCKMEVIKGK